MKFLINKNKKMTTKRHTSEFDVEKLHQQSVARFAQKRQERMTDKSKFLQKEFEIDVKKSYEISKAAIESNENINEDEKELQIEHLESVLSAGSAKLDR